MNEDSLANIEALLNEVVELLQDISNDTGFISEQIKKH